MLPFASALGVGLVIEHHLEQRVVAQAALGLQCHHQLLERQVLVRLGLQRAPLGLLQQFDEGHLPVKVSLEHLGVDEKANQPLGFDTVSVGIRHAHTDVRLPAVAIEQALERGQEQHERGGALLLRKALDTADQYRLQVHLHAVAAMALLRRSRVVEGQLQHGLFAAQQCLPVRQLTGFLPCFHPAALPQGIVGVLDRQVRQRQAAALAAGRIELHQFVNHHLHRPTIGNDVVLNHHQHMFIVGQLQQCHAQQRRLEQIKRPCNLRFHLRHQLLFVRLHLHDVDPGLRHHHLQQLLTVLYQAGTQAFVAGQQTVETVL